MLLTEHLGHDEYADRRPMRLPEGASHGTLRAVRLGCSCQKCMEKRARLRRHGCYVK